MIPPAGQSQSRLPAAIAVTLVLVVMIAGIVARSAELGHVPALNGDEAWYGCNAFRAVHHLPIWWRTPTYNRVNPFFEGPILVEHFLFGWGPSVVALRLPALISGIVTILLAYPLLRRATGLRTAALATVLLAAAPALIVYSRFGWDSSETPLISLLVISAALAGRFGLSALLVGVAFVIHPTNVFLVPIVSLVGLGRYIRTLRAANDQRRWRKSWIFLIAVVALGVAGVVARSFIEIPATLWKVPTTENLVARLTNKTDVARMAQVLPNLLDGVSAIEHTAGRPIESVFVRHSLAVAIILLGLALAGSVRLAQAGRLPELGLVLGVFAALGGLYLVSGPWASEVTYERFAFFLVVPGYLALAALIDVLIAPRILFATLTGATAALLLFTFDRYYFRELTHFGGAAAYYRTGPVEPNLALAGKIVNSTSGRVTILAEDYWSEMPMQYLLETTPRISIELCDSDPAQRLAARPAVKDCTYFALGFDHGAYSQLLAAKPPAGESDDPLGRPILYYWALPAH